MTAPAAQDPKVKGWCPGALRPMMSGDGLVVRVRPQMGRLSREQALGLCDIAEHFGNGTIDVTSRANFQIRGVAQHGLVVAALTELDLIDTELRLESKRNIITAPFWTPADLTNQLYQAITTRLRDWPDLPGKMGVAIDLDDLLREASADFRFETAGAGLILRADGANAGLPVTLNTAPDALIKMMRWFVHSGGADAGRMARHLTTTPLPRQFATQKPGPATPRPALGQTDQGLLVAAPFGQLISYEVRRVMASATGLRATPWGMVLLEDGTDAGGFITDPTDPILQIKSCPGAPACSQALADTRALAQQIAPHVTGPTHISGCAKGCAHPKAAATTITAEPGGYALARNAAPWDTADRTGLTPQDIIEDLTHAP